MLLAFLLGVSGPFSKILRCRVLTGCLRPAHLPCRLPHTCMQALRCFFLTLSNPRSHSQQPLLLSLLQVSHFPLGAMFGVCVLFLSLCVVCQLRLNLLMARDEGRAAAKVHVHAGGESGRGPSWSGGANGAPAKNGGLGRGAGTSMHGQPRAAAAY